MRRPSDAVARECFYERSSRAEATVVLRPNARLTERRQTHFSAAADEGISRRDVASPAGRCDVVEGFDADAVAPFLPPFPRDHPLLVDGQATADIPSEAALFALLDDAVLSLDVGGDVRAIRAGSRSIVRRTLVITPEGRCVRSIRQTALLRVDLELDGASGTVSGTAVGNVLSADGGLDVAAAIGTARRAREAARHRLGASVPAGGEYAVVMREGWNGIWVHEAIGHMLEGDVMQEGVFSGMMGRRVAPETVRIVDDPGTSGYDDEGTPTRAQVLVDHGRLVGVMTDRATAHGRALPVTGNGRRESFRHRPLARQWGVRLMPGEACPDDLLSGIRRGVLLETARRAHVDKSGRFRLEDAAGFTIEHGRVGAPIAGFCVESTALDALTAIEMIGSQPGSTQLWGGCVKRGQHVPVAIGSPAVRFARLGITLA